MINALDRYFIEGVKTNRDFLSNILQNKNFHSGLYSTSFISENYPDGYMIHINVEIKNNNLYVLRLLLISISYLRAASISNQLKGFNKTVG